MSEDQAPFVHDEALAGICIIRMAGPSIDGHEMWTRLNTSHRSAATAICRIFDLPPGNLWAALTPNGDVGLFSLAPQPRQIGVCVSGMTPDEVNRALEALAQEALQATIERRLHFGDPPPQPA